jgi:drug/metabolite transporter (DMT)-like permease
MTPFSEALRRPPRIVREIGRTLGVSTQGMLSVVSVVGSLYPAVTVCLAALILRERPRRVQLAGISLAICGIALISAG